jgi:hypothetical protein
MRHGASTDSPERNLPAGHPFGKALPLASSSTDGGLFIIEHAHLQPGGPPLHLHLNQEEWSLDLRSRTREHPPKDLGTTSEESGRHRPLVSHYRLIILCQKLLGSAKQDSIPAAQFEPAP